MGAKKGLHTVAETREDGQTMLQRFDGQRIYACMSSLPRLPETDLREFIKALYYLIRSGCSWKMLLKKIRAVADYLLVVSTADETFLQRYLIVVLCSTDIARKGSRPFSCSPGQPVSEGSTCFGSWDRCPQEDR